MGLIADRKTKLFSSCPGLSARAEVSAPFGTPSPFGWPAAPLSSSSSLVGGGGNRSPGSSGSLCSSSGGGGSGSDWICEVVSPAVPYPDEEPPDEPDDPPVTGRGGGGGGGGSCCWAARSAPVCLPFSPFGSILGAGIGLSVANLLPFGWSVSSLRLT
uniref:Uncharacterized protein n=1 Tax=Anopheles merus TaxID=30066 RepID=A0A182VL86_ANOME